MLIPDTPVAGAFIFVIHADRSRIVDRSIGGDKPKMRSVDVRYAPSGTRRPLCMHMDMIDVCAVLCCAAVVISRRLHVRLRCDLAVLCCLLHLCHRIANDDVLQLQASRRWRRRSRSSADRRTCSSLIRLALAHQLLVVVQTHLYRPPAN